MVRSQGMSHAEESSSCLKSVVQPQTLSIQAHNVANLPSDREVSDKAKTLVYH